MRLVFCLVLTQFLISCSHISKSHSVRSSASVEDSKYKCLDKSKIFFPPCKKGLSVFENKGKCTGSNEVESMYCAEEEMTNLRNYRGPAQVAFPIPTTDLVNVLLSDKMIVAPMGLIENCNDAQIFIGVSRQAFEDTDPAQGEIGLSELALKFKCLDK